MSLPVLPFGLAFKNTILAHSQFHSLVDEIHGVVSKIPRIESLKGDLELLTLLCCILENYMPKNTQEIDKKNLVITIEDRLFGLTDAEKVVLGQQIDYLHDNGKIKAIKWYKAVYIGVKDWFFRKFL